MPASPLLRRRLVTILTVLCLLTVAAPAGAHPFVHGGELPVDVRVPVTLAMAHGCGGESGGQQSPTREVSLEVPSWMQVVETRPKEGWAIEQETGEDDEVAVVTWSTDDPVEQAPEFVLEVVASGEPGQERFLRVFQGCDDGEYRWVGTPEDPAEDPAVAVTLVAQDSARPAPDGAEDPGVGSGTGTIDEAPSGDGSDVDAPAGDPPSGDAPDTAPTDPEAEDDTSGQGSEPGTPDEPASEMGDEPASEVGQQDDGDELDAEGAADGDGGIAWLVAALVAIALAAGVTRVMKRSSGEGGAG